MPIEIDMAVKGANETAAYLKNFHKDIFDVLAKQVRSILRRTASTAAGKYPQGGYTSSFGAARWPAGIISTAGGSSIKGLPWNQQAPGVRAAIFDQLGRRSAGKTPQVQATIASLNARYGPPQRILWPSWMSNRTSSMRDIQTAFDDAERRLTSKLDGA